MDPLTHTLLGVAVGRGLDRREGPAAAASVWTAIAASHLPDADSLQPFLTGGKIDYLIEHRGWTHTLLVAPVVAAAAVLLVAAWNLYRTHGTAPLRERLPRREDLPRLFVIALAASLLHIVADSTNSYGVHPFAPLWSGWLYGDAVFIVEPLIIAAFLPFAIAQAATRRRRVLWALCALLVFALAAWRSPAPVAVAIALWAALHFFLQRKRPGTAIAWASCAALVVVFAAGAAAVRSRVDAVIAAGAPTEERFDIASTPAPSNPLCWRVNTVGVDGTDYVSRVGWVSLGLFAPATCAPPPPLWGAPEPNAPLTPVALAPAPGIAWQGEFRRPLTELKFELEDCRVVALMSFARVPYWGVAGHRTTFGDLRYDTDGRMSFAEVRFENVLEKRCPRSPWIPPRAELMERAAKAESAAPPDADS